MKATPDNCSRQKYIPKGYIGVISDPKSELQAQKAVSSKSNKVHYFQNFTVTYQLFQAVFDLSNEYNSTWQHTI